MKIEDLGSTLKTLLLAIIMACSAPLLAGCDNDDPFEETGEEIDDALDEAEDEL